MKCRLKTLIFKAFVKGWKLKMSNLKGTNASVPTNIWAILRSTATLRVSIQTILSTIMGYRRAILSKPTTLNMDTKYENYSIKKMLITLISANTKKNQESRCRCWRLPPSQLLKILRQVTCWVRSRFGVFTRSIKWRNFRIEYSSRSNAEICRISGWRSTARSWRNWKAL